jgi:hypothetical protein
VVSANADALSPVCVREATTIEPLVSGQQLITPAGVEDGSVNSIGPTLTVWLADRIGVKDLCLALQHACASIVAGIDIDCSAAGIDEFSLLIAPRA